MGATRWAAVALCFALAGFALAGCGGRAPAGRADATATPAGSATPATPLVEYGRQGGFAGVDDRLVVQSDGSFTITHRGGAVRRGQLSPADLTTLRQVLEASHVGQIPAVTASPGMSDAFTYRVVYAEREVTAADGGVPAALQSVLAKLEELLQRYGGQ